MPGTDSSHPEISDDHELQDLARQRLSDEEAQIGVEPASSLQNSFHLENENDSEPSSGMDQDEVDRLWKDLEAETGFTSYLGYLNGTATCESSLYLYGVKLALERLIKHTAGSDIARCAIVDVYDKDSTSRDFTLRCNSTSATEILSALRQPPAATIIRIVLWDSTSMTEEMLDAIGLVLKIRASFFDALAARHSKTSEGSEKYLGGTMSDDVVVVGQYVMTLVRDYIPASPDAAPIILIAAVDQTYPLKSSRDDQTFSLQRPGMQARSNMPNPLDQLPRWMAEYFNGLESDIKKRIVHERNDMDLKFGPLVTLLQFSTPLVRPECRAIRAEYLHATRSRQTETVGRVLKDVFEKRYLMRKMIEDSEDNSIRLRDYVHSLEKHDTLQSHSLMTLEVDLQQTRLEATRLEAEIRDYLQLQTGELALQESKKSIELSNFQIEEAKRG